MIPSLSPLADALRPRRAPAAAGMPANTTNTTDQNPYLPNGGNGGDILETNPGHHGKSYGEMSDAEFGKNAQDRANRGFLERNAPMIALPSVLGWAAGRFDDSMFNNELANRSAAFAGKGQPMPDEYMGMMYGGGGSPSAGGGVGVNAADLGASLAEGNTTGMFAHGGMVRPEDMRGPNPPGPDQGYVAVHAGEMILNKPQQSALMQALRGRR